jgi:hypothetical protein
MLQKAIKMHLIAVLFLKRFNQRNIVENAKYT